MARHVIITDGALIGRIGIVGPANVADRTTVMFDGSTFSFKEEDIRPITRKEAIEHYMKDATIKSTICDWNNDTTTVEFIPNGKYRPYVLSIVKGNFFLFDDYENEVC